MVVGFSSIFIFNIKENIAIVLKHNMFLSKHQIPHIVLSCGKGFPQPDTSKSVIVMD